MQRIGQCVAMLLGVFCLCAQATTINWTQMGQSQAINYGSMPQTLALYQDNEGHHLVFYIGNQDNALYSYDVTQPSKTGAWQNDTAWFPQLSQPDTSITGLTVGFKGVHANNPVYVSIGDMVVPELYRGLQQQSGHWQWQNISPKGSLSWQGNASQTISYTIEAQAASRGDYFALVQRYAESGDETTDYLYVYSFQSNSWQRYVIPTSNYLLNSQGGPGLCISNMGSGKFAVVFIVEGPDYKTNQLFLYINDAGAQSQKIFKPKAGDVYYGIAWRQASATNPEQFIYAVGPEEIKTASDEVEAYSYAATQVDAKPVLQTKMPGFQGHFNLVNNNDLMVLGSTVNRTDLLFDYRFNNPRGVVEYTTNPHHLSYVRCDQTGCYGVSANPLQSTMQLWHSKNF